MIPTPEPVVARPQGRHAAMAAQPRAPMAQACLALAEHQSVRTDPTHCNQGLNAQAMTQLATLAILARARTQRLKEPTLRILHKHRILTRTLQLEPFLLWSLSQVSF